MEVTYRPRTRGGAGCTIALGEGWRERVECAGTSSKTWRVRVDGTGDAPTVQAGIDSSRHGDTVLVGPGTYYENIDLKGKEIHLKGEEGAEATILDGSRGDTSVITCHSGETLETIIEGFTITGGVGQPGCSRQGGGIYILSSAAIIRGNVIRGNTAVSTPPCFASLGGGLQVKNSTATVIVEGNLVEDNFSTGLGGGISSLSALCLVQGNVVRHNRTGNGDGGGVYVWAGSGQVTVRQNLILENTANDDGGGIYVGNTNTPASMVEVTENLITGNSALGADNAGAPDGAGGGCWMYGHGCIFRRNTVAFNHAETQSGNAAPTGGVLLVSPEPDVQVEYNLIYGNEGGGISVHGLGWVDGNRTVVLTRNLIFGNLPQDTATGASGPGAVIDLILQGCVLADPLFCVIGLESRGELAYGSPALTQPFGVIGAVDHGSCDPGLSTQCPRATWEAIKATYRH